MTKYSTNYIPCRSATNLFHARRYAEAIGRPLNYMVTINWQLLGVSELQSYDYFQDLKKRFSRAWRYEAQKPANDMGTLDYAVVQEAPQNIPNTHWVVHIEESLEEWFRAKVIKFLSKNFGDVLPEGALHFEQVYAGGSLFKYLNKGVSPVYGDYFHLTPVDQGTVYGRRTGTSRSVGITARKRNNWSRFG